jgi:hypothetical protein
MAHKNEPKKSEKNEKKSGKSGKPSDSQRKKKTPSSSRQKAAAESEEEFVAADDPAAELLDQAVKSTPWWVMSLAFHGIVLACLPLVIFSHQLISDIGAEHKIWITPKTKKIDLTDADLPRTAAAHAGAIGAPTPSENQTVIDPTAEISDTNESDDNDDHHQRKGQSLDAAGALEGIDLGVTGRKPGEGRGTNTSIGVGGGSGGGMRFGGPFGGRKNRVARGGLPTASDSAVEAGLRWLARHQSPDGSWHASGFNAQCKGGTCSGEGTSDYDVGVTGLALLSFLGAGYTPQNHASYVDPHSGLTMRYGDVIRKGLAWLISRQNAEGVIGMEVGEMMYNHSIAALALTEAYGLTSAVTYLVPAKKAIAFIHTAQNYGLGWRYTPRCNASDTSVTGWCVMALKSAQISGIEVAQSSFDGAKAWVNRVTDSNGMTGYMSLGGGQTVMQGKNDQWTDHPAMTAVGVLCRIFIDKNKSEKALALGEKIIMADLPRYDTNPSRPTVDSYYWYYATLAMYQLEGGANPGANWTKWNKTVCDVLCKSQHQKKDGCTDGSWDPECDRWGCAGGRVTTTSLDILTLEASYRYESVFGASEKRK